MPKRKKRRAAPKRRRRAAPRRNPSPRARAAVRRARSTFAGLNIKGCLKDVPATQLGMFATKWFAKRFGPDATEIDPDSWGWSSYLKGALGAVVAGYLAQTIKPGWGNKVMSGGLNLMFYKMIQNELIAGNAWAEGQFGAQDTEVSAYLPGDVESDAAGQTYLLGEDYQWHPLPEAGMMGEVLEPVGPLGAAEQLLPVGPLGASDLDEQYRQALLG